jgi:hypothetical protein
MDHKAQTKRYLPMPSADRMAWFTAFLKKYYEKPEHWMLVVVLVLLIMMNTASMIHILGVSRFDLH